MEEGFKHFNTAMFKIHVMEMEDCHATTVSKKSASKWECTVIIPKCTCGYPKKKGIHCQHVLALCKLGRIHGLSRIAIMPYCYTTAQWHNQYPEDRIIDTHLTLKSIKANSTPQDNICYCSTWATTQKKGHLKKETHRKSFADHIEQLAKQKHRTKNTKIAEEERADLESKDVKDGQEGKA